jgi:G:T-mismatch repair DNA endonuclease (very short patch repair protein)
MICPFCNQEINITFRKHLSIHFDKMPRGLYAYETLTGNLITEMYQNGMSANEIMYKIRNTYDWCKPTKSGILKFLELNNVKRRKTPDAMVSYYDRNDVWNKNLTKLDHPAIMRYAESRHGENNPIHTLTHEERCVFNIVNKLKREGKFEELEVLRQERSDKTKAWFANEENHAKYTKAYDAARPKQKQKVNEGVHAYFAKYAALNQEPPCRIYKISKPEQIFLDALIKLEINFKHQFYIARSSYDFFLKDYNLIVEINGLYWHCHELLFPDENMFHTVKKFTAKQIREYDLQKQQKPLEFGFKVMVIWENEYSNVETAVRLIQDKIINA